MTTLLITPHHAARRRAFPPAFGLLTALGLAVATAPGAHAQGFAGAYDPSHFIMTATAGTATLTPTSGPASTVDFLYNYTNPASSGVPAQTYTYMVAAAGTGAVTFTYDYSGNNAFFQATDSLSVVDVTSGASVTLVPVGTSAFGAFDYKGTSTLAVSKGDVFGFKDGGSNGDSTSILQGDLKVTSFSAPAASPEPSQTVALGLGLLGLRIALKARRRAVL